MADASMTDSPLTPSDLRPERFLGIVVPLVLIVVWQVCGVMALLPRYIVAPNVILETWWDMARSGELAIDVGSSLFRQISGFLLGAAAGVTMGLISGVCRPVERFYDPLISLIYPVPKVAILPLIFAWFGLGSLSKIVVISFSIFFPTYIAAFYGARSANKYHLWAAENFGASSIQVFFRVIVPASLPDIFNGLRIALALSFVLMVTTELVVSTSGLGYVIGQAEDTLRFDRMYAAILTIGLIGFCADRALDAVRRTVLRGQLLSKDRRHE